MFAIFLQNFQEHLGGNTRVAYIQKIIVTIGKLKIELLKSRRIVVNMICIVICLVQ